MGGLAYLIGGAMQGVGKGITQKAEADEVARRDAALAAYRQEEIKTTATAQDENDARSRARDVAGRLAIQRDAQGFTLKAGDRAAEAQSEAAKQKRIWDIEDREDTQEYELRKERVKASLSSSAELAKLREQYRLKGANLFDVQESDDGTLTAVFSNGDEKKLSGKGRSGKHGLGGGLGYLYPDPAGTTGSDPSKDPAPPAGFVVQ